MVQLSSKISGLNVWAYDLAKDPTGKGQWDGVAIYSGAKYNYPIEPVTQQPTIHTNSAVNKFRAIADVNHIMDGTKINLNYIKWKTSEPNQQAIATDDYASCQAFAPVMFTSDTAYLSEARNQYTGMTMTPLRDSTKDPFEITGKGVKIVDQTGIVHSNRGFSYVVFEIEKGYKIEKGNNIDVLPKVQNDFTGAIQDGNKQQYVVNYDMTPGFYGMAIPEVGGSDYNIGTKIEFTTKFDESSLPHSKVTFELSHCTAEPSDTTVTNGAHSWTFTAENGYVFDHTGGVENINTGMIGDEIPATNTNVTHLNNYNVERDITISLTAHQQKATTIPIKQNLTNVRSNVTSNEIGRKLNAIQLTADSGYNFQSAIQVLFYAGGSVASEFNIDGNNKSDITIPLNTNKENTITDDMTNIVLTATATKIELHTGYEHNYLITDTELSAFSNERIWNYVGDGQEEHYNVSQFINNLIELPFKVDTQTTVQPISVGRVTTNTVSHETKSRFVTLDLGTINVPAKYHNGYDYQNKIIKLYLPFVPPITIDNENAIEKNIHISYKVDISNGNMTINLDNDGVLFYTGIMNVSSELPFLNTLKNTIINKDTHFNDNDIKQPYLVITRETPILNSDYYPTIERGLLSSYNGSVKATQLNNLDIPDNEQGQVNELLQKGVKINAKSN